MHIKVDRPAPALRERATTRRLAATVATLFLGAALALPGCAGTPEAKAPSESDKPKEEAKPDDAKPDDAKPDDAKPDDAKPDDASPEDAVPEETPDESKAPMPPPPT
ncbi:MAG: hypothetical protein H6713_27945 [Myxococcales bacterium]|nr:hypothetical protein [Myxococcales bacterium]